MKKEEYLIIQTPPTFSDITLRTDHENIKDNETNRIVTIKQALHELDQFGTTNQKSEYYDYWQAEKKKCKIFRVVRLSEEIIPTK